MVTCKTCFIELTALMIVCAVVLFVPVNGSTFNIGNAAETVQYGSGGSDYIPFNGNFSGTGDIIGVYQISTGTFYISNNSQPGNAALTFQYGYKSRCLVPLNGGRWSAGTLTDGIGLYDRCTGTFYLKNKITSGSADYVVQFGTGECRQLPIVGDWDGSGMSGIGVYDQPTSTVFLKKKLTPGAADITYNYGTSEDIPLSGHPSGGNVDTISLYEPSTGLFYIKNSFTGGMADYAFRYGDINSTDITPLMLDWLNSRYSYLGVYEKSNGTFFLSFYHIGWLTPTPTTNIYR